MAGYSVQYNCTVVYTKVISREYPTEEYSGPHSLVTPKMGLCGRCLQVSGYTVVVLVAILLYFHLECQKEKEENMKNKTNSQFLPETTNCFVELGYTMKGKDMELKMGE